MTNHNGVCPAYLGSIDWIQITQWIFGFPEYALLVQVSYTEQVGGLYPTITPSFELRCLFERSSDKINLEQNFAGWKFGSGGCDCHSMHSWTFNFTGSIDITFNGCFSDNFWNSLKTFFPAVKQGKVSKITTFWTETYILPGIQTQPQKILSDVFCLEYYKKLCHTPIINYVDKFMLPCDCQIHGNTLKEFQIIPVELFPEITLLPEKQLLVDRVWKYVKLV